MGGAQEVVRSLAAGADGTSKMVISLHDLDQTIPKAVVDELEPDKWAVAPSPHGPQLAHLSELQVLCMCGCGCGCGCVCVRIIMVEGDRSDAPSWNVFQAPGTCPGGLMV